MSHHRCWSKLTSRKLAAVCLVPLVLFLLSSGLGQDRLNQVAATPGDVARPYAFHTAQWVAQNALGKWVYNLKKTLTLAGSAEDIKAVKDCFALSERISRLEWEKSQVTSNTTAESASSLAEIDEEVVVLQRHRDRLENQVEYTIERQISQVLADEGLSIDLVGMEFMFPPVNFEFDRLPNLLIVSPRNKIELSETYLLSASLSMSQMETIEQQVEKLGVSALVEGIGGIATYPTMLPADSSLEFILPTVAHEWFHHYFFFKPLGWHYSASYEMTTINETAANIAGNEIGALALKRYYGIEVEAQPRGEPAEPPAFDFNKEMRQIRLTVDSYLEKGQATEAEKFMEEKRLFLASKGYYIRKLNQAYFAFHGSYADSPTSVSPIGEDVKELRRQSGSLGKFVGTIAQVSSYDELKEMLTGSRR